MWTSHSERQALVEAQAQQHLSRNRSRLPNPVHGV
jgi:hypothetical protein